MLFIPLCFLFFGQCVLGLLLVIPFKPTRKLGMAAFSVIISSYVIVVVKTLSGCLVVLLASSLFNVYVIQQRVGTSKANVGSGPGALLEQVQLLENAMEAALIGFCLVVGGLLERLHAAMQRSASLEVSVEMVKKQAKGTELEYMRLTKERAGELGEGLVGEHEERLKATITELRAGLEAAQAETEAKVKAAKAAEASVAAMKKQSEGLHLEMQRLMEDNESLHGQLAQADQNYSRSSDKKRS
eukprot:TRINITY_DN30076_c0_g1_i1.p1 TRINITY_DN30076_c0_g1~~TRINITY_DN30076_c0_g1_i1.p1  ORF type:complete len:243 (-),score=77.84 TRINITY_DN30076_c0_g1_i1:511-1239(-)